MGLKLVIFGSRRGSNFKSIVKSIQTGYLQSKIVAVVVNNPNADMIKFSKENGFSTIVVDSKIMSREEHEQIIISSLSKFEFDLICLAGYMRILSSSFLNKIKTPVINIHPSLLPAFPGMNSQKQAFEHGVKITGCTIHVVDENLDSGKILGQRSVKVLDDDTLETLTDRILKQEHKLYPEILWLIENKKLILS